MRYRPRLDDFDNLPVRSVDDTHSKSIIEHEYPHLDGAVLEDMGARARRFRIICLYTRARYDEGARFASYITGNRIFSFVHPELGLLKGRISESSERHDENLFKREVSFTFIEEAIEASLSKLSIDVVPSLETSFKQNVAEQKAFFASSLLAALGVAANDILSADIDPSQSLLSQLSGISIAARKVIGKIDDDLSVLAAAAPAYTSPADSPLSLVSWGTLITDCVILKAAQTVEAYAVSFAAIKNSPNRFADSFFSAIDELLLSVDSLSDVFTISAASRGAFEIAGSYDTDQQNRETVSNLENLPAFDSDGNYIQVETPPSIANVTELERSLSTVRQWLQAGITIDRSQRGLQDMARKLMQHLEIIKLNLENVVTVNIDNPTPLHLICTSNGLPYASAERVLTLNPSIINPSFCSGAIKIYASA